MRFAALENYLARLADVSSRQAQIGNDGSGQAYGRFYDWNLHSVFQPVRSLSSGQVIGYEAFARSYGHDMGLSVWKLLDGAASDDESVELDRLCRMLHAINFFRQSSHSSASLFLSVHERLLTAVDGNHGMVFRRVLDSLDLPAQRIVIQLPAVRPTLFPILSHVAHGYRRNGFRVAVSVGDLTQAAHLLALAQPNMLKIDAAAQSGFANLEAVLDGARALNTDVIFKRVESGRNADALRRLATHGRTLYAQGYLWDMPHPELDAGVYRELRSTDRVALAPLGIV
jgi:EAL domain-containing protein (putative c-di-GMP-specific phosphodiesterase class I)